MHSQVSAEPREDGGGHLLAMTLDFTAAVAVRTLVQIERNFHVHDCKLIPRGDLGLCAKQEIVLVLSQGQVIL